MRSRSNVSQAVRRTRRSSICLTTLDSAPVTANAVASVSSHLPTSAGTFRSEAYRAATPPPATATANPDSISVNLFTRAVSSTATPGAGRQRRREHRDPSADAALRAVSLLALLVVGRGAVQWPSALSICSWSRPAYPAKQGDHEAAWRSRDSGKGKCPTYETDARRGARG